MRFLIFAGAVAVLSVASSTVLNRPARGLVDEATWKVESESSDHITYVRKPIETTPTNNVDCNLTTTAAPLTSRRRSGSSASSKSRLSVRSGIEGHGERWKSGRTQSVPSSQPPSPQKLNNHDGYDGDHLWSVSHQTDDHITYKRRSSTTSGQGQAGELRRLGKGRDSVLARVVVPGKEDAYTEEALLEGAQSPSSIFSSGYSGYPTNELVHPYVKKTRVAATSARNRTKSLHGGSRGGGRRQLKSQTASSSSPPNIEPSHEDHPPRVGEVLNGWIVVSKSKDHISWERWGSTSSRQQASASAVANLHASNTQNENRLRSLKSLQSGSNAKRDRTGRNKLIPSAEGQLIEGFPRIFNTYSRAFYVNERNVDQAGSIRTSLSDTTNWNVGDELAGWKVISKDHRGIVWQRMSQAETENTGTSGTLNEEDLLEELNKKQGGDEDESSESDSSSESESNEGDNVYRGPPGTWYLSKETKNSITWKRDNTPKDVIFEMNAFPKIGDVQSGWKVRSKSRGHIEWVRVNNDGSEVDSNERVA